MKMVFVSSVVLMLITLLWLMFTNNVRFVARFGECLAFAALGQLLIVCVVIIFCV